LNRGTEAIVDSLLAARLQMAISLGFHILFAVAGMAMPLLMVLAEGRHLRTGEPEYLELARRWAKGTAILFAVGAVSGTVLSFELGLLWPHFMRHAGPLIGMPFSLEGFAFFLESIALGIYLYGWKKVSPRVHLASGAVVALSGLMSGVFVVAVNAWMNTPQGFRVASNGELVDLDLWRAFAGVPDPGRAHGGLGLLERRLRGARDPLFAAAPRPSIEGSPRGDPRHAPGRDRRGVLAGPHG
jgi:cytochrome d ubiquinol oxidase subunit I